MDRGLSVIWVYTLLTAESYSYIKILYGHNVKGILFLKLGTLASYANPIKKIVFLILDMLVITNP